MEHRDLFDFSHFLSGSKNMVIACHICHPYMLLMPVLSAHWVQVELGQRLGPWGQTDAEDLYIFGG